MGSSLCALLALLPDLRALPCLGGFAVLPSQPLSSHTTDKRGKKRCGETGTER